jgi:hypothetical protein
VILCFSVTKRGVLEFVWRMMGGGNGESYTNGVIVKLSSHLNPYMNCHVVVVPH